MSSTDAPSDDVAPAEAAPEAAAAPEAVATETNAPEAKKQKTEGAEESETPADAPKEVREEPKPMPKKWVGRDPGTAMLWYYRDKEGRRQGPYYPGQMRQWFTAGFFSPRQEVAPSFKGEVPREFVHIEQFYASAHQKEAAFVAADGIALWPMAQADAPDDDDDRDAAARPSGAQRRPQWLEDSLRRQRAGIKRKMIYGPVERENYN